MSPSRVLMEYLLVPSLTTWLSKCDNSNDNKIRNNNNLNYNSASDLKGYLSSAWISIEQSVMVSGIVQVIMVVVVHDWSCAVELLIMGAIEALKNYRPIDHLSDFIEN